MHCRVFRLFGQAGFEFLDCCFVLLVEHIAHTTMELLDIYRILGYNSCLLNLTRYQCQNDEDGANFIHVHY